MFDQNMSQNKNTKGEQNGRVFANTAAVTDLFLTTAKRCVVGRKGTMQRNVRYWKRFFTKKKCKKTKEDINGSGFFRVPGGRWKR